MADVDGQTVMAAPDAVITEVARYAQGPTAPRKPWFRKAVHLAWTAGFRAGVATERIRYLKYEAERGSGG